MEQIERTDIYRKESGFNYVEDGDSWAFNDGVWHFNDDVWSQIEIETLTENQK